MCTKAHFQSLEDNKMVETTVIDAWTCLLNENEILRSDASPLRLFLNTETTVKKKIGLYITMCTTRKICKRCNCFIYFLSTVRTNEYGC